MPRARIVWVRRETARIVLGFPESPPSVPPPTPTPTPAPQLPPPDFHAFNSGVSLLHGWFPLTIEIVTVVALVAVVGWRTKRWRLLWVPVSVVIAILGALGARLYTNSEGLASDPAPLTLWLWVGVFVGTVAVAILGWRATGWRRRALSVIAVPLSLFAALLALNQWVGYFPTVQAAWGGLTAGPLPGQVDQSDLPGLRAAKPSTGKFVEFDSPDAASGFKHRSEYVYLPPAWFTGDTPPRLPVVMMIGGEFNTPADWMRSGNITPVLDGYAQAHGGMAPIFVFVDSGGSFNNDTECVNGPRGNAADHLTKDVRPFVISEFGASPDPANWGIVGWSMGGTCAIDLTVTHPELFHAFVDIAGDHGPIAGTKEQTIDRLYGGDVAQWAANDPMTVMAKHGPYVGVSGWFEDTPKVSDEQMKKLMPGGFHPPPQPANALGYGGHDEWRDGAEDQVGAAQDLCHAATAVNISCSVHTIATFHTWQFAAYAFADALPWLAGQISTPVASGVPAASPGVTPPH
jgi:S-formylglutathione hydrolase FrmB